MPKLKRSMLTLAAALALAGVAAAAPLDAKTVPADAKWVVHVDVDSLAKSQTWKLIEPRLAARPNYQKSKAEIERLFAAQLPRDLRDVTLFGPGGAEADAVVVVRAAVDQERVKTLLSLGESYTTRTIGGQTVHGWRDEGKGGGGAGKQMYGVLDGKNAMIVGQSAERVAAAAEVLSGRGAAMANTAIAPSSDASGLLVYVAGDQIADLAKAGAARSPVLAKLQTAVLTTAESKEGLVLTGRVVAQDMETAANMVKAIEGFKGMLAFAEDPDAGLASEAAERLTAKQDDKTVSLDCTIAFDTLTALMERAARK